MSDLLESVQYRAAKIVSGAIHRTSHNIVYQELGWETLVERRRKLRLKMFYKMVNDEAPTYLQGLLPDQVPVGRNLRNEGNFIQPRASNTLQNSFIPRTALEWNDLDEEIKSAIPPLLS